MVLTALVIKCGGIRDDDDLYVNVLGGCGGLYILSEKAGCCC